MNERSPTSTESPTDDASAEGRGGAERSSLQRVLLVTDRARERHVLMSALETLPVATAFASSRYDALRLAETLRPDVIVVDAELRGDEGWAVCEELLKGDDASDGGARWQPSFILLHGERDDTPERAKALGLGQLLRWPFAVDEARSLLEVHLSEPGYGSGGYSTEDVVDPPSDADGAPDGSVASSEDWMVSPVNEAETPVQGWPPLEFGPSEGEDEAELGDAVGPEDLVDAVDSAAPPPSVDVDGDVSHDTIFDSDAGEVSESLDEPGDAHAAIAMLEPKVDSDPAASPQGAEDDPRSGSLALFPGVQPPPTSPPPIANLFAMLDDAPSGDSSDHDSALDDTDEQPAVQSGSVGDRSDSSDPALSEEAPEFVDVVEDEVRQSEAAVEENEPEVADDPGDLLASSPPPMDLPPLADPPLHLSESGSLSEADTPPEAQATASDDRAGEAGDVAELPELKEPVTVSATFQDPGPEAAPLEEAVALEPASGAPGILDQAPVDAGSRDAGSRDAGFQDAASQDPGTADSLAEEEEEEPLGLLSEDLDRPEPERATAAPDPQGPEDVELEVSGSEPVESDAVPSEAGSEEMGTVDRDAEDQEPDASASAETGAEDRAENVAGKPAEDEAEIASERAVLVEADLGEEIFVRSPSRDEAEQATPEPVPPTVSRPSIAPTLADLFNADGVTQVLLLERGGGVVFTSSKTPQLSMSQLAQHSLELFACADLVLGATDTGREGITDALVAEGASGCVLLQSVDDHFLVVCVDKNSGLGQVRFLVRRVLEPLRAVLSGE